MPHLVAQAVVGPFLSINRAAAAVGLTVPGEAPVGAAIQTGAFWSRDSQVLAPPAVRAAIRYWATGCHQQAKAAEAAEPMVTRDPQGT